MKNILLFGSITVACGLLLTNLYTSIVDARSWGSNIPSSIATAREYYKSINPGNFFRIFSPANQILSILALVLFWKCSGAVRICLGAAVVLYVACDALTFAYFYPRNAILFIDAGTGGRCRTF